MMMASRAWQEESCYLNCGSVVLKRMSSDFCRCLLVVLPSYLLSKDDEEDMTVERKLYYRAGRP